MNEINFGKGKFSQLLRSLSIIKDLCNDCDIQNGVLRQRLNDHTCIFEMNLNSVLGKVSIPLTTLKQTLDLVKCFSKTEPKLLIEDQKYTFSDDFTSISFQMPYASYIDNKYISQEELETMYDLSEENLIFSCDINKVVSDRMKSVIQGFSTNSIQVEFEDNKTSIVSKSHSTDKEAKFLETESLRIFDEPSFTRFMYIPFVVDHDSDLRFFIYEKDETCIAKIMTKIDEIDLTILTRSTLRLQSDQD